MRNEGIVVTMLECFVARKLVNQPPGFPPGAREVGGLVYELMLRVVRDSYCVSPCAIPSLSRSYSPILREQEPFRSLKALYLPRGRFRQGISRYIPIQRASFLKGYLFTELDSWKLIIPPPRSSSNGNCNPDGTRKACAGRTRGIPLRSYKIDKTRPKLKLALSREEATLSSRDII